ncbi:MAG: zinc ribbon domain-containing protein [Kofleriaceae bacterium]
MPLFDIECQACHHTWEDMVRTGATPPPCPVCASTATEKLLTIGAAILPVEIVPGKKYDLRPKGGPKK